MPPTYVFARDHLQSAVAILQGVDGRTRQLRYIIERTISLIDESSHEPRAENNVLDFTAFRDRRASPD
ncbi:MAG TPA: hypothetical protein VGN60_08710 [Devosia sp.]|jgi:hypothetical protein|nr:hypothetical protein [Devosia sp.]